MTEVCRAIARTASGLPRQGPWPSLATAYESSRAPMRLYSYGICSYDIYSYGQHIDHLGSHAPI